VELLEQYIKELEEDTKLDEFNMKDVQMKLPAIKHKWVGRLMRLKMSNNDLQREKKRKVYKLTKRLVEESPVKLSFPVAEKRVVEHDSIIQLDNQIKDAYVVIEFLEKVEKIFSSMSFDLKNLIEIIHLETT